MKRNEFIKILAKHNVFFLSNGSKHDIYQHRVTGKKATVPRHGEIENILAKEILKEIIGKK